MLRVAKRRHDVLAISPRLSKPISGSPTMTVEIVTEPIMAVDGSRIGLPRSQSNESEFLVKRHRQKGKSKNNRKKNKQRKIKKYCNKSAEKKSNTVTM